MIKFKLPIFDLAHFTCFLLLISLGTASGFAQVFQQDTFMVDTTGKAINWKQFPDFNLPFTIVYHGDPPGDSLAHPLRKGFSHIGTPGIAYKDTLYPHQRALTLTGMATNGWAQANGQPWALAKSPFGNDVEGYKVRWKEDLDRIAREKYKFQPPEGDPRYDIVIADIEHHFKIPQSILRIKNDSLVPITYQQLSDNAFVKAYQEEMSNMYAAALELFRTELHPAVQISSYSDVPIRRIFFEIYLLTWQAWKQEPLVLNYLTTNNGETTSGNFYELQDVLAPSIYNFYNVDEMEVGENYLAYMLFQIEANAAWSDKPQLAYVWLNYHYCCSEQEAVQPWIAEATAIFPLMAGVQGTYVWLPSEPNGYDTYEYFIKGLYRMSQYVHYFDGEEEYVQAEPAHASFVNGSPLWRGVVNDNKMLIAAQNPFAEANDTTIIPIQYGNWQDSIALIGKEVFLHELELPGQSTSVSPISTQAIEIFPNPAQGFLNLKTELVIRRIRILDLQGREVMLPSFDALEPRIDVKQLSPATYLLEIHSARGVEVKKFVRQ